MYTLRVKLMVEYFLTMYPPIDFNLLVHGIGRCSEMMVTICWKANTYKRVEASSNQNMDNLLSVAKINVMRTAQKVCF